MAFYIQPPYDAAQTPMYVREPLRLLEPNLSVQMGRKDPEKAMNLQLAGALASQRHTPVMHSYGLARTSDLNDDDNPAEFRLFDNGRVSEGSLNELSKSFQAPYCLLSCYTQ